MEETDQELIAQYRQGHVGALEVLVARYRNSLYGYIVNMTGGPELADDVFQEVWLKAIRKLNGYRDQNFPGWLMRIARNIVIDKARRKKPDVSLDQVPEDGRSPAEVLAGDDPGPLSRLTDHDLGERIAKAVGELPLEQREVFLMRVEAGLSFKEIAKAQRVSINTALARMHYAIAKLKAMLDTDYQSLARG